MTLFKEETFIAPTSNRIICMNQGECNCRVYIPTILIYMVMSYDKYNVYLLDSLFTKHIVQIKDLYHFKVVE